MSTNQPPASDGALQAFDYWQIVKNRYGIILLTFLLVFLTAMVLTYVMPKRYQSTATLEVKPKTPPLRVAGGNQSMNGGLFFPTEFEVIKAQKTLDLVIDSLDLTSEWGVSRQAALGMLQGMVSAQNIRGTALIEIQVRSGSARDARLVAEHVSKAYRKRRTELEDETAQRALAELREAVRVQEDQVEEKRKTLTQIIRSEQIAYHGGPGSGVAPAYGEQDEANEAARRYTTLEAEKVRLESQIDTLLRYDGEQLIAFAAGLNLPENIIRSLHPQYLEAQRQLEALKVGGLGANHPNIRQQVEFIEGMRRDLDEAVVALRETLRAQLELAEEQLDRFEIKKESEEGEAIHDSIARHSFDDARTDFENAQRLLEQLKLKLVTEEMQTKITEEPIIVHADPVESSRPVSPNVTLNLVLGAIVGLVFGVGIAFFLEYLDTSVKTLEDVERYLAVPVLAVIPKDVGILHRESSASPDAEAYRILRTNIEFNRKNPEDNAITVVSGGAGEGKSTTLVNLAYICAQGGYTTLMVDGDLRRPTLHTYFDINNAVGLTNYLTTELMLEDVILQTPIDNLYFMPSGILPADAAGILNSRRMSELIQDVKQRFDLVLIDSPPILGVSDASVLASEVDLTMIVIQHRKLPRKMLMRVKQAVENVGGHVIGVVLNNVDVRSDSQYQYYTSYYTYYSPSEVPAPTPSPAARKPEAGAASAGSGNDLY